MDEMDFFNESAERFEEMLSRSENWYYDAEEIVDIITFYIDINDVKYAEKALEYAFKLHPNDLEIQVKKAEVLVAKRKYSEAEKLISQLLSIIPDNADLYLAQARIFSAKKQHQKAINWYLKAIEKSDELEYILSNIGNEYLALNEIDYALDSFKRILEYTDDDEYAFFSVIHCYEVQENLNACIEFLTEYIDKHPFADFAWFQLGQKNYQQKNYQAALTAYDYTIIINELFLAAYWEKAKTLERLKKFELAIETYQDAIAFDETPALTYYKIGKCHKRLQQYNKAFTNFYNALYEDPQLDKAWAEIAYLYEKQKNTTEMLYYIKRACELAPENTNYLRKIITYLVQIQEFEEAIIYYDRLIQLDLKNPNNILGKVEIFFFIKAYPEAVNTLTEYIENHDYTAELLYYLAIALYYCKKTKSAKEVFQQAYQLDSLIPEQMQGRYQEIFKILL